jgi:hypothetical protein
MKLSPYIGERAKSKLRVRGTHEKRGQRGQRGRLYIERRTSPQSPQEAQKPATPGLHERANSPHSPRGVPTTTTAEAGTEVQT